MDKHFFQFLTELTVIIHMMFILFVVAGGFFIRKALWFRIMHIGCVVWGVYVELSPGLICPLTTLENYFAQLAGLSTYEDDFITRYLVPIIYQESLSPGIQYFLAGVVIVINAIAYTVWWRRRSVVRRQ